MRDQSWVVDVCPSSAADWKLVLPAQPGSWGTPASLWPNWHPHLRARSPPLSPPVCYPLGDHLWQKGERSRRLLLPCCNSADTIKIGLGWHLCPAHIFWIVFILAKEGVLREFTVRLKLCPTLVFISSSSIWSIYLLRLSRVSVPFISAWPQKPSSFSSTSSSSSSLSESSRSSESSSSSLPPRKKEKKKTNSLMILKTKLYQVHTTYFTVGKLHTK